MSKILKYLGNFIIIATSAAFVWQVAKFVIENERNQKDQEMQYQQSAKNDSIMIYEIRGLRKDISNVKNDISDVQKTVDRHTVMLNALDKSYTQNLKNDKKFDVLLEYMTNLKDELKKNNKLTP